MIDALGVFLHSRRYYFGETPGFSRPPSVSGNLLFYLAGGRGDSSFDGYKL